MRIARWAPSRSTVAKQAIADAGLRPDQIDGFASSALFPTAGAHTVEDGVSTVTSAWLARHLGVNPRYAVGFQGNGQIPGSVALAVNAIVSGAARLRAGAPRAAQSRRAVPRQCDA